MLRFIGITFLQKFGVKICNVFEISLLYSIMLHLFDQNYSDIVEYYYNLK